MYINIACLREKKGAIIQALFVFFLFVSLSSVQAADQEYINRAKQLKGDVNLFYGQTCPHCHKEILFLDEIRSDYPNVTFNYFEASSIENYKLFDAFAELYNSSSSGVPRTFIGEKAFIGFDPGNGELVYSPSYKAYMGFKNQIQEAIGDLSQANNNGPGSTDPGDEEGKSFLVFILILLYLPTYVIFRKKINKNEQNKRYWISGLSATIILAFFIFVLTVPESLISGYAQNLPFPFFVFVISLADGFNPCAFTVLFILLSLLTYTKSKRDMKLVGTIFILTSAIMYFLFIMLMIFAGAFFIERWGELILKILGIFILIAGVVNLKDYLWFGKGVSLTLDEKEKSKIVKKARNIVKTLNDADNRRNLLRAIGATIFLAIGVNIVELGCTAILPTVYMGSLIGRYGTNLTNMHVLWTSLYAFVYVIPLFAILTNFIYAFKSNRITESQGRVLKLVAGVFMVLCGTIMILKPSLLMFG